METRAHHVLIGLFTVITVGAALLFGLWLAKSSIDREFSYFEVLFNEEVSGLTPGSAVEYSGIKVGEVQSLQLDPLDTRKVRAYIRIAGGTPIKQDTHARLALANITGSTLIRLYGGSPQSPLLSPQDGKPPLIVADPSPMSRLMANSENFLTSMNQLMASLTRLFSDENAQHVSRTLDNLEKVSGELADHRGDITRLIGQLDTLSRQANAALADISRLAGTANGLLDQDGRRALGSAVESMAAIERSTRRLEKILGDNQAPLESGLQGLGEIGPALQELRMTLGTLNQLSRRLGDDPAGFLLGREKIEEFQP